MSWSVTVPCTITRENELMELRVAGRYYYPQPGSLENPPTDSEFDIIAVYPEIELTDDEHEAIIAQCLHWCENYDED